MPPFWRLFFFLRFNPDFTSVTIAGTSSPQPGKRIRRNTDFGKVCDTVRQLAETALFLIGFDLERGN